MDPNAIASMTPQARRALLAYLAALGDEEAVPPVQPTVDPTLTQGSGPATQSTPTPAPAPSTLSVASLPNPTNGGPELINTTSLSDTEIFHFLNLPSPHPASAHATVSAPQPPLPHATTSPLAFASHLTGNPTLGYSPTAAQVLAASTGSAGPGCIPPSNGPALFPTTAAVALPASSGTVPYGIPPVSRNTWGTSRPSAPGIPTQVHPSLGTRLFPPSNSNRQSNPLASMSAVLQPHHAREARATARQARKPVKGPIHTRHWFLVPSPDIFNLNTHVKIALTKSGLGKFPVIMKDYTPAQVDAVIRATFPSVPFDKYSYRFMELNRLTGSSIQPTGLDPFPSGDDIGVAYSRKEIGIIQLTYAIPQSEHNFWTELATEMGEAEQESTEELSHPAPEEIIECPVCDQSFVESVFSNHERSCPVSFLCDGAFPTPTVSAQGPPPSPKLAPSSRRSSRGSRRSPSLSTASSEIPSSRSSIASSTRSRKQLRKIHLWVRDSPPESEAGSSPEPSLVDDSMMPCDEEAIGQQEEVDGDHGDSGTQRQSGNQAVCSPSSSVADGDEELAPPVLALSAAVDGSTDVSGPTPPIICNFCDEPWPQHPSTWLLKLVKDVSEGAKPDPTPTNPNHLDVPVSKSIDVCMRHRLEKDLEDNGSDPLWPTTINFDQLPERIMIHTAAALDVARSPQGNPLFVALKAKVNDGLDLKSINASADPLVQTNCGYYGERGFTAISDTLRFSIRRNLKAADIYPLDPSDFYFYVIVPYVAFLLIREDRPELDEEEAWKELARSNKFGMLHYSEIEYE